MKKVLVLLSVITLLAVSCAQSTNVKPSNDSVKADSVKVDSTFVVE